MESHAHAPPVETSPPRPLTPRQERFCHYFVAYANAAHAARAAGFSAKSAKHQGYRLLRTGRVRARIQALHAEMAHDNAYDAGALVGKLENLYRRATAAGRFHTATRAVELQARLVALRGRHRNLPTLPAPALPAFGPRGPDEWDPESAAIIARAKASLRRNAAEREGAAEDASAAVGKSGHPVGIGSAEGSREVGGRSAGGSAAGGAGVAERRGGGHENPAPILPGTDG